MRYGQGLKRAIGRTPTKVGVGGQSMRVPVETADDELDMGALDHYWHPDRDGVEQAPESFNRMLAEVSTDVRVVRPPHGAPLVTGERAWLVWYRCPRVTHPLSPGWLMLRDWRARNGEPLPLDPRVFSFLYSVSARAFGSGKKYWDHCVAERDREVAAGEQQHHNDRKDRQDALRDSYKIKNIGSGSKFAQHHDGTVLGSRGSIAWHNETRKHRLPSELIQNEKQERERIREARG